MAFRLLTQTCYHCSGRKATYAPQTELLSVLVFLPAFVSHGAGIAKKQQKADDTHRITAVTMRFFSFSALSGSIRAEQGRDEKGNTS